MSLLLAVTNDFAFKDRLPTKSQDRLDGETIKTSNVSCKITKGNHNLLSPVYTPYRVSCKGFDIR